MASAKKKFLRANTYNQIETATDELIARTTDEVRISEKLVDKGYMSNLLMAIHSELPQSELTYEELKDANERLENGDIKGYQVPKEESSFQQMDNMTLSLSLSVDSLHLTRTETHFVVTAP
ncbi:MAG: hypothetical protein JKY11_06305 [Alphaproteobacteria bacterium]|nr:hypothetical protein [Alphaproteobacteria bacterium]